MARSVPSKQDGRLAGVIRALLIAQLTISLAMVIYCYNTSYKVMSLLKQMNKFLTLLLYALILLHAYCMKLHYTSGFRIITWLVRCPNWPRAVPVTKLWLVSGTLLATNGLLMHAACKSIMKTLMKELSTSLRVGMSQYLTEPTWKKLIDTMQLELNCCGVDHPDDWHTVPWLNIDVLYEESDLVMKFAGVDGRLIIPVAPYSCCSPYALGSCFHDPLQQSNSTRDGRSARGCVRAAQEPLHRAAVALHALAACSLALQLLIVMVIYMKRRDTQYYQSVDSMNTRRRQRVHSFPYLSQ